MHKTDYYKVLRSAREEYEFLVQKRVELENRILHLKQTIAGLVALCEQNGETSPSNGTAPAFPLFTKLTSGTRQVLAQADSPMHPPELRDALVHLGLNVAQYANPLAVIHNTLIRLRRQGEAVRVSGAWVLTDKGRLASKIDLMDMQVPPLPAKAGKKLR